MLSTYLRHTIRRLVKDRQFSLLNAIGLSTGLACALLIYLWVSDEYSVDKWNANDSRLYQVLKSTPTGDGAIWTHESTQGLLARSMAHELPEVEYAVSFRQQEVGVVTVGDKHLKATPAFADRDFFHIFTYSLIEGNPGDPLADPRGVLLSDKLAEKLFHTTTGLVGNPIDFRDGDDAHEFTGLYKVAGVYKSSPANATQQFDLLFSYDLFWTQEADQLKDWGSNGESTYLLLKPGTDIAQFEKKVRFFTQEKIRSIYKGDERKYMLHWEGELLAQRFSDRYLHGQYVNGVPSGGRIAYVQLFSIIAIFILVIACINFMNLSTARGTQRAREVGVKKAVGASRGLLILQFLGESLLLAFASLLIAVLITLLLLPALNSITGKDISLQFGAQLMIAAASIAFFTGMVSGSYPALFLSGFRPALVLKTNVMLSTGAAGIRKALVVFQFAIAVTLILGVLVVYRQMQLIRTTDLGYDRENVLRIDNEGYLKNNLAPFLTEVRRLPGVISASDGDGDFLGHSSHSGSGIGWEGKDPNLSMEYYGNDIDYDFFPTLGMKMAAGRPFMRGYPDSNSVIFNQSAIAAMGLKDPVGKTVTLWGHPKQIVGVVMDYHFESLYKKVGPAFLTWHQNDQFTYVRIKPGKEAETIGAIKSLFNRYNKGLDFTYSFLDDDYNSLYVSEQRVAVLSRYFSGMAILISCLGLFGLAAFTAQRRQKEIGIRKVLGASVSRVALLLSADLLRLVVIAIIIAFPLAWWGAHTWLHSFAYRVSPGAGLFGITAVAVIAITLLTIGWQTVGAALANPVKALRSE
jgi:putative ABC transport system permease protein